MSARKVRTAIHADTPAITRPAIGSAHHQPKAAFATRPTSSAADSIVQTPSQNDIGVLEVREEFCVQCHQEAGRAIHEFEPDAILYGDIWGEDRIFSFHPWDQDQYPEFNTDNREVRPAFASNGIVERYNQSQHPDTIYRVIE